MCRSIKTLFNFQPPVTEEEIRAASLQFVRKVSGFNKPSKANGAAFLAAVDEIAAISGNLLSSLETNAPPRNRTEKLPRREHALRRGSLSNWSQSFLAPDCLFELLERFEPFFHLPNRRWTAVASTIESARRYKGLGSTFGSIWEQTIPRENRQREGRHERAKLR